MIYMYLYEWQKFQHVNLKNIKNIILKSKKTKWVWVRKKERDITQKKIRARNIERELERKEGEQKESKKEKIKIDKIVITWYICICMKWHKFQHVNSKKH